MGSAKLSPGAPRQRGDRRRLRSVVGRPRPWYTLGVCAVLALLFLVVPATEIFLILQVGGLLGAWPTLAVIAVTAVVGAALAKSQGVAVLQRLQASLAAGQGTGKALVEGVLVLAAGVTLLAPGFLTDAIGLALLVPPIRSRVAARLASSWNVVAGAAMPPGYAPGDRDEDEPPPPGVIDI